MGGGAVKNMINIASNAGFEVYEKAQKSSMPQLAMNWKNAENWERN